MERDVHLELREKLIIQILRLRDDRLLLAQQALDDVASFGSVPQLADIIDPDHPQIVSRQGVLGSEPVIRGTRTPVRAIVENIRLGLTPERIQLGLPHLTLAQIYDALGFYSDHKAEIEMHIERNRIPEELIDPRYRTTQ
jgi:uncharacterized protein (DUF433 family)